MVDYDVLVGVLYKPTMFVAGLGRNEEVKMARQGVRVLRPTRPAGPIVDLAELNKASPTRDDDLNFALARFAGLSKMACKFRHGRHSLLQSSGRTETVVVATEDR